MNNKRKNIIKNIFVEALRFVIYAVILIVVLGIIAPFIGKRIDLKGMVEKQADKAGIALKDIEPVVVLSQCNPDIVGISYRDSIDLLNNPALMNWKKDEVPFWLAINSNLRDKNYKNPCLFLNFGGKVVVRAGDGWVEADPNYKYYIQLNEEIQPGKGFRLNPLFIKFPNEGTYFVRYSITGDNELPTTGTFAIYAQKDIVIKR